MRRSFTLLTAGVVALVSLTGDPAAAQSTDVTHFVRLMDGNEVAGRLLKLEPDQAVLLIDQRQMALPLSDVSRIERRGDSLKNGAVIGAAVMGAWCAVICGQGLSSTSRLPLVVAANAAIGALIGAGLDAARTGRTTIYVHDGQTSRNGGSAPPRH
jgi:hypothetical protein